MFPRNYSSRYGQSRQSESSMQAGSHSSPASSSRQQNLLRETSPYASGNFQDTYDHESELANILLPPSPPPSLDQILASPASSRSRQTFTQTPPIYSDLPQTPSPSPSRASSSRSTVQQVADTRSTSRTSRLPSVPGVHFQGYTKADGSPGGRWVAKYKDVTQPGSPVAYVGSYGTQEEAARALQEHRAERNLGPMKSARRWARGSWPFLEDPTT